MIGLTFKQRGKGKRQLKVAPLLAALLLLPLVVSGCKYTAAPADLLQKPTIAEDKQLLTNAIARALPQHSLLTLPLQDDDYKEAVRLIDLDGDGVEEAVVTYYGEYSTPEVMLLRNENNSWRKWLTLQQPLARDIDWLKLTDFDNDGHQELLVGWIGSYDSPNTLELYSFQTKVTRNDTGEKTLKPLESFSYTLAEVGELVNDGIIQLAILLSYDSKGEDMLSLHDLDVYEWRGSGMKRITSMELIPSVNSYDTMVIGDISPRHRGIIIEGNTGAHSMMSYMYAWENGELKPIYPDGPLFMSEEGFNGRGVYSEDVNGDGILELHRALQAPGSEQATYADTEWINQYVQWDGRTGYEVVTEQYQNYAYGIRLTIPKEWRGRYTFSPLENEPYGLVSFHYWDERRKSSTELAALYGIRREKWSELEETWQDNAKQRPYFELSRDSGNVYIIRYAKAPPEQLAEAAQADFMDMVKALERFPSLLQFEHHQ